MSPTSICCPIQSGAMGYAVHYLQDGGYQVNQLPEAGCEHLLLPVPSFPQGDDYLKPILKELPANVTVYGGFLHVPPLIGYRRVDFLTDPYYLARNAAITAECTVEIVENILNQEAAGHSILILGWGRIGKCLGKLLQAKGTKVIISARKDTDLALIEALGYQATHLFNPIPEAEFIINTIPAMVLPQVPENCYAIELASKPGMIGKNIISARGLPGKMRPADSGKLIAETFIRLSQNQEVAL